MFLSIELFTVSKYKNDIIWNLYEEIRIIWDNFKLKIFTKWFLNWIVTHPNLSTEKNTCSGAEVDYVT